MMEQLWYVEVQSAYHGRLFSANCQTSYLPRTVALASEVAGKYASEIEHPDFLRTLTFKIQLA